jgi:hypothetical protein
MTGFGQGPRPDERELVVRDGFDELEKESAVRFYAGKTWSDVLAHLRALKDEPLFRAAYFLEEWSVLSPPALAYYARAHLEFLSETLATDRPDEEFVFHLLGQLYQVFYIHKGSPFTHAQTDLLRRVVQRIAEEATKPGLFEYFGDDIIESAKRVLTEMGAHHI